MPRGRTSTELSSCLENPLGWSAAHHAEDRESGNLAPSHRPLANYLCPVPRVGRKPEPIEQEPMLGRKVLSSLFLLGKPKVYNGSFDRSSSYWIPARASKTPIATLVPRTLSVLSTSIHSSSV